MSETKWFGHAAHLIVGSHCRFHLATQVGDYLVSTVGEYYPDSRVRAITAQVRGIEIEGKGDAWDRDYNEKMGNRGFEEIGYSRLYETMVFRTGTPCSIPECGCGLPGIDGEGLDMDGYNDAASATAGHMAMVEKWGNK